MKNLFLLFSALILSISVKAQNDLSLARVGNYVMGVYLFIDCEPVNQYDYIGKIDKFNVFESDSKEVEKIIEKAKKKNPYFNGMIFKKDFKHVELIKFTDAQQVVQGFRVGDAVVYRRYGVPVDAVIKTIDTAKERCSVEYIDENGETKIDGIALKELTKK